MLTRLTRAGAATQHSIRMIWELLRGHTQQQHLAGQSRWVNHPVGREFLLTQSCRPSEIPVTTTE